MKEKHFALGRIPKIVAFFLSKLTFIYLFFYFKISIQSFTFIKFDSIPFLF
jgi:hypothetical protein